LDGKAPYELLFNKKLDLTNLAEWGTKVWVLKEDRGKREIYPMFAGGWNRDVGPCTIHGAHIKPHCRHRKVFWLRKSSENAIKGSLLHTKIQCSESVSK
jgi:hypothetical protein